MKPLRLLAPIVLLLALPTLAQPLASDVTLETMTGVLHGTLLAPAGDGPHPVVLLIAGSGATDRDGNSKGLPGRNDSLKMVAAALADNGIASLRYDKRGIGASGAAGPKEEALRFETYVDDAKLWVRKLKADARFSSVTIAGHSEGSLVGMLAAGEADGFVSIAGASQPAGAVLREQLRTKLPPPLLEENERILKLLEAGNPAANVPPQLAALYRPSVQPYLISWLKHDPAALFGKLKVPTLIVQGKTDLQVSVDDARRLNRAKPSSLVIVEGMNHVLKLVDGDLSQQLPSYGDPELPVAPKLIEELTAFVLDAVPQRVPTPSRNVVRLTTEAGEIDVALYVERAPLSSADFLRYVERGLYDGGAFYRVVREDNDRGAARIDVVQGGLLDESKGLPPVAHETTRDTGVRHTDGTVSLARSDVGTGRAAYFFICVGDQPALDFGGARNPDGHGFAAFGRVIRGMDVVRKIHAMEATGASESEYTKGQMLTRPVTITSAKRIRPRGDS
jgi:cyclophilin family peptidyl-prolyl cis-trans isomerase/pimeloyl-ACP methyl ester carboxylesterase